MSQRPDPSVALEHERSEFELRLAAALLLRDESEPLYLGSADGAVLIGKSLAVAVSREKQKLFVQSKPVRCKSRELRASLLAVPCQAHDCAEFTVHSWPNGISVHAAVDLGDARLFRAEMRFIRAAVELEVDRIRRAIHEASADAACGDDASDDSSDEGRAEP